jgi:hypothetical protein
LKEKSGTKRLVIITNDISAQKIWKKLGISYSRFAHSDILEYNYSFGEYTKVLWKNYLREIKQLFHKKDSYQYFDGYKNKYFKQKSRIGLFLLILVFFLFFFLFIFYFAVNKTYISITPEITVKIKAQNFVFQETAEESVLSSNIIPLKKIEKIIYTDDIFATSWIKTDNLVLSRWTVILHNKTKQQLDLRVNSRLQAENW